MSEEAKWSNGKKQLDFYWSRLAWDMTFRVSFHVGPSKIASCKAEITRRVAGQHM